MSYEMVNYINFVLYNHYPNRDHYSILNHLLQTLTQFPNLTLTIDTYTFPNTVVNLLFKLTGVVSTFTVAVWVPVDYPYSLPMFNTAPVSGRFSEVFRQIYPAGNTLLCLLQILTRELEYERVSFLNRAAATATNDLLAMEARHVEDTTTLSATIASLRSVGETPPPLLKEKVSCLKKRVLQPDVLASWITVQGEPEPEPELDPSRALMYEVAGKESTWIDWLAEERAVEDVIYALDKAVLRRVLEFDVYMGQIRDLAREQYYLKAQLEKNKRLDLLDFCVAENNT